MFVRPKGKIRFPASPLSERPEIAALVGECIALWSQVEAHLAVLLSAIMKTETAIAAAVFLSIRNSRAQREAMNVAAKVGLDGRELEMFSAISLVYQSLDAQRTDLAHGLFGIHEEMSDAILWVEASNYTRHNVEWSAGLNNQSLAALASPPFDERVKSDTFVYKKTDLISLRDEIKDFWKAVFFFGIYLKMPKTTEDVFQQLYDVPPIQRALVRLREGS
jgi:hypothetical protein